METSRHTWSFQCDITSAWLNYSSWKILRKDWVLNILLSMPFYCPNLQIYNFKLINHETLMNRRNMWLLYIIFLFQLPYTFGFDCDFIQLKEQCVDNKFFTGCYFDEDMQSCMGNIQNGTCRPPSCLFVWRGSPAGIGTINSPFTYINEAWEHLNSSIPTTIITIHSSPYPGEGFNGPIVLEGNMNIQIR